LNTKNKGLLLAHEDVHEQVLMSLRQIIRAVDLHSRKLVHDHGLTGPQLLVLRTLDRMGVVPVGTLAKEIILSHATVTGVLDRLEKRVLVRRTRSDLDKRKVLVGVTEAGLVILESAPSLLQEDFVERLSKLKPWEQTLILSSVQRIASMMQADELEVEGTLEGLPLSEAMKESVEVIPPDGTARIQRQRSH
jgi:DNA-binding MarR family transcriptional regulator